MTIICAPREGRNSGGGIVSSGDIGGDCCGSVGYGEDSGRGTVVIVSLGEKISDKTRLFLIIFLYYM